MSNKRTSTIPKSGIFSNILYYPKVEGQCIYSKFNIDDKSGNDLPLPSYMSIHILNWGFFLNLPGTNKSKILRSTKHVVQSGRGEDNKPGNKRRIISSTGNLEDFFLVSCE